MNEKRILLIDELRGLAIILMVVYHFLYSLMFVFSITLNAWVLDVMLTLQPFGAGLFILIAGISSCLSRNNSRRGLIALMVALLISMVTHLFIPSQAIYFGVLHFYSVAILIFAASRRVLERIPLLPWLPLFLVGTGVGRMALANRLPLFFYRSRVPVLSRIGQHSLLIYVVHQPVILAMLWLVTSLT